MKMIGRFEKKSYLRAHFNVYMNLLIGSQSFRYTKYTIKFSNKQFLCRKTLNYVKVSTSSL